MQRYICLLTALGSMVVAVPVARAQSTDIRGEGLKQTVDCRGGEASVEGNGNRLVFRGNCAGLDMRGNGNTVRIELAGRARVHLEGNGNHVGYTARGGEPSVTVLGEGDEVGAGE